MDDEEKSEKSGKPNSYLRFSGMAFQMFGTIMVGAYGGMKLDEYLESESNVYTAILSILSIFVAMYLVIKDVLKK
ncbi:MAG: AtpZ/AtpI family protein [Flavobacteriales bacterium]|nr:AtpZ/AtpI family protein [Flavobacteriales bacterium]